MKFLTKSPISHTSNYFYRKMLTSNGLKIQKNIFYPIAGSKFRLSPFTLHPNDQDEVVNISHSVQSGTIESIRYWMSDIN